MDVSVNILQHSTKKKFSTGNFSNTTKAHSPVHHLAIHISLI